MQFHNHGYVSHDPRVQPVAGTGIDRAEDMPPEIDVLIVGTGPAGLITAAQLAQFPSVSTRIIECRSGRLEMGQADGIQARSVETFQAFGFASRITEESHRTTTMSFWKPDPADPSRIIRAARVPEDPTGISEFPHLLVNQARVQDYFLEVMANAPARMKPDYGVEFLDLAVRDEGAYPVTIKLRYLTGPREGEERVVRAKYVVGADGARSAVRTAIGRTLDGEQAMHAWGVMDVLAVTDFPDIRVRCVIQSHDAGNILLISREGGYLVRLYVDLGQIAPDGGEGVRRTSIEQIISKANQILHPYTLEVREVVWHSVYEVGHRLVERFDDVPASAVRTKGPRVFIVGDACHTHSAKGGQGMNVSMQDGFNLGWKLGHVLDGRAPDRLLDTYSAERRLVAEDLIDYDKKWSTLMAAKPAELVDASEVERFSATSKAQEFPAGFGTRYQPSILIAESTYQKLATGFPIGKRFKSAMVVRVADANPVHLGHHARADGRWRLYAFADLPAAGETSSLGDFAEWIVRSPRSPLVATPNSADADAWFDLKVIYQQSWDAIDLACVPSVFLPRTGPLQLIDYEKVYASDPDQDIFDLRYIDRAGVLVVVRPDQYVAGVLPIAATDELAAFFDPILVRQRVAAPLD